VRSVAAVAALLLLTPTPARAEQYEVFISITEEEELYDLFTEGQIGEDTLNTLVDLLQRGVDINGAGRDDLYALPNLDYAEVDAILAYRAEAGRIDDPAALVAAGVIDADTLLSIAPFLVVRPPGRPAFATDGLVRAQTRWSQEDDQFPPTAVLVRLASLRHLSAGGLAVITRSRLDDVVHEPNRDALAAGAPTTQIHLPKAWVQWKQDELTAIAGTFRAGFGQRLTFDVTDRVTPTGLYPDDDVFRDTDLVRACRLSRGELLDAPCDDNVYVTPDFRWRDGLLGAGVHIDDLPVGPGRLQVTGFASAQPRSIYQYEIYDRGRCADPTDDADPACSAPQVWDVGDDPLAPAARFSFSTLPDIVREDLGGGNLTYRLARRTHVGVTAWGADVTWLAEGIDLDFQEWSRYPYGGPYGAVGTDAAWGVLGWLDLQAEAARSFDSQPAGGGGAAVVRAVGSWKKKQVEASLRWYDTDFANPYARPIAAADEYDGNRARDEAGGRLRFSGLVDRAKRVNLRALADLWRQPSTAQWKTQLYLRTDVDVSRRFRWGLWGEFDDKDLRRGGRDECYEVILENDENGEPIPCGGMKMKLTGRLRWQPSPRWWLAGQVDHSWQDDGGPGFRRDLSTWAIATLKPAEGFTARLRARYLNQDLGDSASLEESLWTYVDLSWRLASRRRVRLRWDYYWRLDDRQSTLDRSPQPENWLWLEVEEKF
jgi:hypothetical protein